MTNGGSSTGTDVNVARLRMAIARLSRRLRPNAAAGSLTTTEVNVLIAADRHGPLRLSDLAGFVGNQPNHAVRPVPKLEATELLRRLEVEGDRRVTRVGCPDFRGARFLDSRCGRWLMPSFKLERCEHTQRRVTPLAIVKDLEVFEDRAGQFDACAPAFPIEQFNLHATPERFHHRVVIAIAD